MFECPRCLGRRDNGMYDWLVPLRKLKNDQSPAASMWSTRSFAAVINKHVQTVILKDDGTDDGTAGEVIRPTCSCPVLTVKDDGTDDGLTFRHCAASNDGRWPVKRTLPSPDGVP